MDYATATMNEGPLIIEMVGIAGAGKSTLKKVLGQCNPRIQAVVPPNRATYLQSLIRTSCHWLPIYLRSHPHGRGLTLKQIRVMGYLETWPSWLRRQMLAKDAVLVLDPGSICWLSALRQIGPETARSQSYEKWWDGMLTKWAAVLDAIIWLDAPDELLYERVLTRDQWHEAQEQPQGQVLERFACSRRWYEQIVAEMAVRGSLQVLRFRTDQISTQQMADRVLAVLNL